MERTDPTGEADAPRPSKRGHGDMSARIEAISRQSAPAPAGRQIAILVLGLAVVGALIWQFVTGFGPSRAVEESHRERQRPGAIPSDPESAGGAPAPESGARPFEFEAPASGGAVPSPGASIPLPEGLDAAIASRLRLALSALDQPVLLIAEDGARSLPRIVADTAPQERAVVRTLVVERLASLVKRSRLRRPVLDAALALAGEDATGLEAVRDEAVAHGFEDDDTAAVTLLFLDVLAAGGDAEADARIVARVKRGGGPLHVRVLAARLLVARGAVPDALKEIAADPEAPAVLREALGGE